MSLGLIFCYTIMTYLKCEISVQLHLLFVPLCMHVKQQNKILFCTCLCVFVHVSDYIFVFVYYTGLSPSHLWACVVSVMFGLFLFFYTHSERGKHCWHNRMC